MAFKALDMINEMKSLHSDWIFTDNFRQQMAFQINLCDMLTSTLKYFEFSVFFKWEKNVKVLA